MRTRVTMIAGGAILVSGFGLALASARSAEPPAPAAQRPTVAAPQKAAAVSMVVYKSQT